MFQNIQHLLKKYFSPPDPLPPGIHHFQAPPDADFPYRLHLRIEQNGEGVLILNAATILHLNQTAAEYAYHLIQGDNDEDTAAQIAKRFQINKKKALEDYLNLKDRLSTLINTPDLDPVTYLGFEHDNIYSIEFTAPLRLDCALTYRMVDTPTIGAPVDRVTHELNFDEWKTILDKAWQAGIPHIIFTGGEPTLRPDLPDLIEYAESLGMVTGVLSDGLQFTKREFFTKVLNSGIDHLMLVLDPQNESSWTALQATLAEDLHVTVHLTVTQQIRAQLPDLLKRLAEMQVKALSLSESDTSLKDALIQARELAAHYLIPLIWDLPVPYSRLNPIELELEEETSRFEGTGRAWLYVEPDGDVLPGQGINKVLGNLLTDPWEQVLEQARKSIQVRE